MSSSSSSSCSAAGFSRCCSPVWTSAETVAGARQRHTQSYPGRGERQKGSSREPTRPGPQAVSPSRSQLYGEEARRPAIQRAGKRDGLWRGRDVEVARAQLRVRGVAAWRLRMYFEVLLSLAGMPAIVYGCPKYPQRTRIPPHAHHCLPVSRDVLHRIMKYYVYAPATARGREGQLIAMANTFNVTSRAAASRKSSALRRMKRAIL